MIELEANRLLRPTPEQYQSFCEYLCEAHSWYKHLPLMGGRWFAVFVAPDAGIGRLVARLQRDHPEQSTGYSLETPLEGSEFTEAHPRLHYGWKTTKEYRTRFGYLDYKYWQSSDGLAGRDAGPPIALPLSLAETCGFVLYPYVHPTFSEAVTWNVHADALVELQSGAEHVAREQVLELANLAKTLNPTWQSLSELERNWEVSRRHEDLKMLSEPSIELQKYLKLKDSIETLAKSLREVEAEKIRRALAELDDYLQDRS